MTQTITIRPETVRDYAVIGEINALAFSYRASEPAIVVLHRQRPEFDAELSLVAEKDGKVVGHVLFSARILRMMGQDVQAVNLAPIAIHPAYQKQGIGGRLIEEGHAIARAKGYVLSMLLGHTSYYPRFGYQTHAYGASTLRVQAPADTPTLEQRGVTAEDVPALEALWRHEENGVDFAVFPGCALLDWISPNPSITSTVYLRDGVVVGYTRIHSGSPLAPRMFMAQDMAAAQAMLTAIAAKAGAPQNAMLELPLHPDSASTVGLGKAECQAWGAGMACNLAPNPFDEYYGLIRSGARTPGRAIWPVEFELE